jgi:hypothetical protein
MVCDLLGDLALFAALSGDVRKAIEKLNAPDLAVGASQVRDHSPCIGSAGDPQILQAWMTQILMYLAKGGQAKSLAGPGRLPCGVCL